MITALGILCMFFCVCTTWRMAYARSKAGQSMQDTLAEAWTNIAFGFAFNYVLNLWVLPMQGAEFGTEFTFLSNWWMGWIYTAASFLRQTALRRFYNWRTVK